MIILTQMEDNTKVIVPLINYLVFFAFFFKILICEILLWKSFISKALLEPNKDPSNKRLIIFLLADTVVACIYLTILHIITPLEMFITIAGLVGAGIGVTSWEKVAMKKSDPSTTVGTIINKVEAQIIPEQNANKNEAKDN